MKHSKTLPEASELAPIFSDHNARKISGYEAKIFWQNQHAEGRIDVLFKRVQEKLKLLWQKIKDGSATDQEYTTAFLLVCDDDLEGQESNRNNNNIVEELVENKHQSPIKREELTTCNSSDFEENVTQSDPEATNTALPLTTENISFGKHTCGPQCLSNVYPYFSRRENPLKFPVMCCFQRWHAKSGLVSRPLDVIYKTPCGKSLKDFEDVHNYLCQTECDLLFLEHFSFNTYLQLDRHQINIPALAQEADISRDVETVPVSFSNEIDDTSPSSFTYRKTPWPHGYSLNNFTNLFLGCCDCTDGCLDVSTCACLQLTAKEYKKNESLPKDAIATGYKHKRLQAPIHTGLYECNISCQCNRRMCQNRVVQHGLQVRLQVYKTKQKGWGVRCLDDLDKGTFVCIYAGRILILAANIDAQQCSSPSEKQNNEIKASSICSKRKRCGSLSDSEITILPSNSSSSHKSWDSPLTAGCSRQSRIMSKNKATSSSGGNVKFAHIRRPKTKTSILQKRKRQLMEMMGAVPVQDSSDDDDFFAPATSLKLVQQSSLRHQGGILDEEEEENDDETADKKLHAKKINTIRTDKVHYLSDNGTLSIHLEKGPLCQATSKNNQHQSGNENVCVLDASKEGNVARFFNHSCSPNLFVQHVFVESHSKKFPWVAFFAKSHIKAGTELTWEYNYDIGSVPEKEIPCLCGQKTCKNITI